MTATPIFDDRLSRALDEEAEIAGESEQTYIERAVILRLVADATRRRADGVDALLDHLAVVGMDDALRPGAFAAAMVRDPARLQALEATGLLDSPPEERYDRIVALAARKLDVPTAAFSLVDRHRQFFKSAYGLSEPVASARESSIDYSVCQYAVAKGEPLIVEDARTDPLLRDHPAVVDGVLVAYAGIPLIDDAGHAIGTLCVWDHQPRHWSAAHVEILKDLAAMVHCLIYIDDTWTDL